MTGRQKQRLLLIAVLVIGISSATALMLVAFQQNLLFFLTPTQVSNGEAPAGRLFRMGGMVREGSLERLQDITVRFAVTDFAESVPVEYSGILPDLFREGQGVVVRGEIRQDTFYAEEVLAKHDENYMPPEAQYALDAAKTLQEN